MIELIVLIAIATIGVIYTSSTGDAESTAMAEKTAKDALKEAEGQSGIGILGIDVVARKMRRMVGLSDAAVTADTLAEYRGAAEAAAARGGAPRPVPESIQDAFVFVGDDGPDTGNWADDDGNGDWDEEWDDAAMQDLVARVVAEPVDEDADDMTDDADDAAEDAVAAMSAAAAQDAAPEPQVAPEPAARPAAAIDTQDAPLVEEFDPEQDILQIGYAPGQAGNGRIGIAEDPLRPGAAAVTLGGRCVAVVLNGYGKVRAHHIDLVCEDDADMAA